MPTYIPAGRTSIVHRDEGSFQIQTEYAHRPYPRITTSIILNGQVVDKQEQKLQQVIGSIEEQNEVQDRIQKQHIRIVGQTKKSGLSKLGTDELDFDPVSNDLLSESIVEAGEPKKPVAEEIVLNKTEDVLSPQQERPTKAYPTVSSIEQKDEPAPISIKEMLSTLDGFEYLFLLNPDGEFKTDASRIQFTKLFKKVAKSLQELVEIFPLYSGDENRREQGVYEVKRDRLYFVSTGEDCFFVTVCPTGDILDYEQVLKDMFVPTELSQMLKRMKSES